MPLESGQAKKFRSKKPVSGKAMSDLQAETRKNTEYLRYLGYKETEIYAGRC